MMERKKKKGKPETHGPQKTRTCNAHRSYDLEITKKLAFLVSKLPLTEGIARLQRERGRNREASYSPPEQS